MTTQFDDWLRALAAAQKGPATFPAASRGRAYSTTISLQGNWTGAAMRAQVRLYPDAPGTPVATFAASGPVLTSDTSGQPLSTFTLSLNAAATAALPADSDIDGIEQFAVDVLLAPSGGAEDLLFGGVLPLLGRVTV
jgi:hypothetical protein